MNLNDLLNLSPLHPELRNLHDCIDIYFQVNDEESFRNIENAYNEYQEYLLKLYIKWFSKLKDYDDNHIAEQLFIMEIKKENINNSIKFEIIALKKSCERIFNIIIEHRGKANAIEIEIDFLKILKELVIESIVFINKAHNNIEGTKLNYGYMKRMSPDSNEAFLASIMFYRDTIFSENSIPRFMVRPTSVFLIRQSIELKIKNLLGIHLIFDLNGNPLKIPGDKFLEIIPENNDDVQFPVKKSVLKKIHSWTQYYVHGGFIPFIWQIEWAQRMIGPMFHGGEVKTENGFSSSIYGNIKLKRTFYENIEDMVKNLFPEDIKESVVILRMKSPECLIIDD